MISEKHMENSIIANPEKYIGETGMKLLAQQFRIGNYIFDILFEDRHGAKLIVEIQKGTLDRNHTYKIIDYYLEYKEKNPNEFIELMVIANKITDERKRRLSDWGVSYKEIDQTFFGDAIGADKSYPEEPIMSEQRNAKVEQVITSLFSGVPFKPKFQHMFDNCDTRLRNIFIEIIDRLNAYHIKQYSVDKPDYRLCKKYIFCEFVLQKKCIVIGFRVDNFALFSNIFDFKENTDLTKPGKRWLSFRVDDAGQIEETVRLILEVYNFSD